MKLKQHNQAHDFDESLKMSHKASDLPIWKQIYRRAFPTMLAFIDHRQDGEHQRAGIDRSVILENSKQILIDEKVRGRNKKTGIVYEDIAIEYLSDKGRNVPGWACKPLLCDYICYAIAPLGKAYLLPVQQLQNAFAKHRQDWISRYPPIRAYNERGKHSWTTISVGVPPEVLFKAMGNEHRIRFDPMEISTEMNDENGSRSRFRGHGQIAGVGESENTTR